MTRGESTAYNPPKWLNRTVLGAGLTSALGDFCYETATVILPGFLTVLGLPAAVLGMIEGAADALASFTKMAAGFVADKLGHRKALVLAGYGMTPLGQCLIALAASWPLLLAGRLLSWFGKGLRGPLRDAIVVQAVHPGTRGRAFGFHRAADTMGAVVGPLLGVLLLGQFQAWTWEDATAPFRAVLWLSVLPGSLAVLAFLLLVRDPEHSPNPSLTFLRSVRDLPKSFKRYLAAVGLFAAGDFSHSLLILAATQLLTPAVGVSEAARIAGLLYVGRNLVQVFASYPVGAAADRFGHSVTLVCGYVLGIVTAVSTAAVFSLDVHSIPVLGSIFVVAGLYVAVQEALESTVAAEMVDSQTLALSYGALGAVNGTAKFLSSAGVGWLWTLVSPAFGFAAAAALMTAGTAALATFGGGGRARS